MCCLIDAVDLPGVAKMCERNPDTVVVIDHLARIGASGTIRDEDVQQLCSLAKYKNTYVKVSAFYALGKKKPPYLDLIPLIRQVYDAFGPQRLMWASDCPYQVAEGHNYHDSIALVRDRIDFLKEDEKQWLLRKTAEKVYFGSLG
jgi:predicted TIM-barrel fold metal-dependent hydrolase